MKIAFIFLFVLISLTSLVVIVKVNEYVKNKHMEPFHVQNKYSDYADYGDYGNSGDKAELDQQSKDDQMRALSQGLDKKYDNITDPISDVYLPDIADGNSYVQQRANEYTIISIYKNILQRQPTSAEIGKHLQEMRNGLDEEGLKMHIYNSGEYKMHAKMQSNDVEPSLVSTISAIKLVDKLKQIYKKELGSDAVKEILLPLKDCYIHLQYNDYLFRSMLIHRNYKKFEKEVLEESLLSREKLLYIFNKHFLLTELKVSANNLKRIDVLNRQSQNPAGASSTSGASINSSDMLGAGDDIKRIMNDGNQVFNINVILNEDMLKGSAYSNDNDKKVYNSSGDIMSNVSDVKNEGKVRIYDPIKYKQHYRGDMRYRPNVCSYGTKQVVQPLFVDSKTLFLGTDLKEASENTQVGSIMPKFEYREYEEAPKGTY